MTRPSRGERRSATTTRQTGSFLPPTRVSRMETDMTARQDSEAVSRAGGGLSLAHELAEVGHAARREPLHEPAHLAELLDELVDLLDGRTGSLRDAQPPRSLDELGAAALLRGHRQDDRLHAVELA